jgi:co-chaperonin GroES (HSP10)
MTEKTLTEKNLLPLHDRVLVRIAKPPTESAGTHGKKIILAAGADQRIYNEGEVLAVGPGVTSGLKAGDFVVWEVFKGQSAGHFDEGRWILKDAEILAKVLP